MKIIVFKGKSFSLLRVESATQLLEISNTSKVRDNQSWCVFPQPPILWTGGGMLERPVGKANWVAVERGRINSRFFSSVCELTMRRSLVRGLQPVGMIWRGKRTRDALRCDYLIASCARYSSCLVWSGRCNLLSKSSVQVFSTFHPAAPKTIPSNRAINTPRDKDYLYPVNFNLTLSLSVSSSTSSPVCSAFNEVIEDGVIASGVAEIERSSQMSS